MSKRIISLLLAVMMAATLFISLVIKVSTLTTRHSQQGKGCHEKDRC